MNLGSACLYILCQNALLESRLQVDRIRFSILVQNALELHCLPWLVALFLVAMEEDVALASFFALDEAIVFAEPKALNRTGELAELSTGLVYFEVALVVPLATFNNSFTRLSTGNGVSS